MRLAIVSDIHGNLPALKAVLADIECQDIDDIIVAGDMVSGPQPRAVVEHLRDQEAVMIRGNHENYALDCSRGRVPLGNDSSKQWEALQWAYNRLGRDALEFIGALPDQRVVTGNGSAPVRIVHGSPESDRQHIFPNQNPTALTKFRQEDLLPWDQAPPPLSHITESIAESVLVCGHSHIPWQQPEGGCLVVNPGSVGLSINGDPRATYAILTWTNDGWSAAHRHIAYDLRQLRSIYETTGFLSDGGAFARACLLCSESGHNVALRLVQHTHTWAMIQGLNTDAGIPDDMWDTAVANFDWAQAVQPGHPSDRL